jgi:hypothetical protein
MRDSGGCSYGSYSSKTSLLGGAGHGRGGGGASRGRGAGGGSAGGSRGGKAKEYVGTVQRVVRASMRTSDKRVDVVLDDGSAASFDIGLRQAGRLQTGKKYAFHLYEAGEKSRNFSSTAPRSYALKGDPRPVTSHEKFRRIREEKRGGS